MNYIQLAAAIQGYTENYGDEFTAMIPTFVRQAEQRVQHTVQLPTLRKTVQLGTVTGVQYVNAPDDFLSAHSLALISPTAGFQFLIDKDANLIREAYPLPTMTGMPRYYAIFGVQPGDDTELRFLLGPTPNAAYQMELTYSAYPDSIVDAGTSWLGDNFDSVLLYGALLEANTYMKGEADVQTMYQQRYEMAVAQLKTLGDGKMRRDSYRSGQVKVQVN